MIVYHGSTEVVKNPSLILCADAAMERKTIWSMT